MHAPDSRITDRRRRAESITVERIKVRGQPTFTRGPDQECQIVAPIAGDDRVGATVPDLGHVRREVAHLADRMQLVPNDAHLRRALRKHRARIGRDLLAKAVVLIQQIDLRYGHVGDQRLDQRRHAHLDMRIETKMPRAATLIGQCRIDSGVVQKQHALRRNSLVVFADPLDQRRRNRRRIALQHEWDAGIGRAPKHRQRFFNLAL